MINCSSVGLYRFGYLQGRRRGGRRTEPAEIRRAIRSYQVQWARTFLQRRDSIYPQEVLSSEWDGSYGRRNKSNHEPSKMWTSRYSEEGETRVLRENFLLSPYMPFEQLYPSSLLTKWLGNVEWNWINFWENRQLFDHQNRKEGSFYQIEWAQKR